MIVEKGDLVLVSNGVKTTTCIVLTLPYQVIPEGDNSFYYSYCLDDGLYGLIYNREIISIVAADFAPDFEFESELFDTNYSYFPPFFPFTDDFDDDSDED